MDAVEKYQRQLLERAQFIFARTPISDATTRAFLATPRHKFVRRYRDWGIKQWHDVRPENLAEHLATLYDNRPLILFGDDDNDVPSTISQPAFVLRMLDLLQVERGHKIFELGAGSGWNAALMGQLVGAEGRVHSLEIIPEVAATAARTIESLQIANVHVVAEDGGDGHAAGAPYDRAIFTAGSYDLPRAFYTQVKEGGLLLMVIKSEGGGDNLFLLRKAGDHFESTESMACGFVQLRGKHASKAQDPTDVEQLPEWAELKPKEIGRTPFWWGGKGDDDRGWRTLGIRSFLSMSEPSFRAFKTSKAGPGSQDEHYFGLWEKESKSLVLSRNDSLIAYGHPQAKDRLQKAIRDWVDLGMPSAASFELHVYPRDVAVPARERQWIVKKSESQFVWRLPQ